ncbi:hypothetical protein ULF88_13810 [Halopseudomonas pachastrellae]|nr:hypothetical protein [Halopseudomonas pachastrellae]
MLQEMVVQPGADILGRSASDIALRTRFRHQPASHFTAGSPLHPPPALDRDPGRRRTAAAGDPEAIAGFASEYGCAPLAPRSILIPDRRLALTAVLIMLARSVWPPLAFYRRRSPSPPACWATC